jgi:hypothetical protein
MILAAALVLPGAAAAAVDLSLEFTGVATDPAFGEVMPYLISGGTTSFAGQPVDIHLLIAGAPANPYVSNFTITWSDQTYSLPFITGDAGDGFVNEPENDMLFGFYSAVTLGPDGGSIHIFPTNGYLAATDGDFDLDFSFAYSTPQDPLGSFTDNGLTGSGTFDDFKTFLISEQIGPYDAESTGPFTLSGVVQTAAPVPEPATWLAMLAGFAAMGALARNRGRSRAA